MSNIPATELIDLLMLIGKELNWKIEPKEDSGGATLVDIDVRVRVIRCEEKEKDNVYIPDALTQKINSVFGTLKVLWEEEKLSEINRLKKKVSDNRAELRVNKALWDREARSQGYDKGYDDGYDNGIDVGEEVGFDRGYKYATDGVLPDSFVSKRRVILAIRDFCGYYCSRRNNHVYMRPKATASPPSVEAEKGSCHNCPIFCLERFINETSEFY